MEELQNKIFSETLWDEWCSKESENYSTKIDSSGKKSPNYLKKGYKHFDHRFWFPDRKDELKAIIQNGLKFIKKNTKEEHWWQFQPFIKLLIKTPRYKYQEDEDCNALDTKIRPICFASHIDSLIFSYYSFVLTKKYEEYIALRNFQENVLAYRSNLDGKCNIQFAKEVFDDVRDRGNCTAIAIDIKGYFDHIDHKILKAKWKKTLGGVLTDDQFKIFKVLTQYTYVNKDSILKKYKKKGDNAPFAAYLDLIPGEDGHRKFKKIISDRLLVPNNSKNLIFKDNILIEERPIGIPQGSPLSSLLSNIYLIDYDEMMSIKAKQEGFLYRRYCDDILIVCDTNESGAIMKHAIDLITSEEYYLTIQDKKVEMIEFKENKNGIIRAFNKKKIIESKHTGPSVYDDKKFYKSLQYLGFEFNGQNIFIRASSLSRYYRKMKDRVVKTVSMAYGAKGKHNKIGRKNLIEQYTHLGKRNFIAYALNASKKAYVNSKGIEKEGMNSPAIRKQISRHFQILEKTITIKNFQRYSWKVKVKDNLRYKN